jgi:acyl transferase domain-containing protein
MLIHFLLSQFPTSSCSWPKAGLRRASINSFGYGGTNAHAIVDDAFHYLQSRGYLEIAHHNTNVAIQTDSVSLNQQPSVASEPQNEEKDELLFLLTASDENGIQRQASALVHHLDKREYANDPNYLANLAYTLSDKRTKLPWKSFILASSTESLRASLSNLTEKPIRGTRKPSIQFLFTGQGAQWVAMGKELLRHQVFRNTVSEAHAYLQSLGANWSLMGELYSMQRNDQKELEKG